MTWRVAGSILVLHAQLKAGTSAAPPATSAAEWGTIDDAAHASTSDHHPHSFRGWGNDIVTAGDFPDRPDLGLDARRVLDDIRRSRDPRVKYGISHRQMFSSYATSRYPAWTWRPYTGSDGHWTHGHLSVVGDARADGDQPWQTIGAEDMTPDQAQMLEDMAWREDAIASGSLTIRGGRYKDKPFALNVALKAIADAQAAPALTDEQLEALADKVAERLSGRRFIADPDGPAS